MYLLPTLLPNFCAAVISFAMPVQVPESQEPEQSSSVVDLHPRRARLSHTQDRQWPDYQRCLLGAPRSNSGDGPDRSLADFFWCKMAAQRGWSIEETAHKLVQVSEKAQERARSGDEGYALDTAQNAAAAAERGRTRGRG